MPVKDPNWNHLDTVEDLPSQLREEIAHFFAIYKGPEGKIVDVHGWFSREEAWKEIEVALERFQAAAAAGKA